MNWEIFGLVAGVFTLSGFLPQIIKGYKSKSLDDLSYFLNILLGAGMVLWMIYGVAVESFSIILVNVIGVMLNVTLISMKYKYSKK